MKFIGISKFLCKNVAIVAILCGIFAPRNLEALSLRGPVVASSVSVTGTLTVSTMTATSLTVNNHLNIQALVSGTITQMKFSSSTVYQTISSTNFQPVPTISQSIAASSTESCVRVSLAGNLLAPAATELSTGAFITIFRDTTTNLGDQNFGLAAAGFWRTASLSYEQNLPVGFQILDCPGDTNSHSYGAYIRVSSVSTSASFPYNGTGYLLLEEILETNSQMPVYLPNGTTVRGPITANNVAVSGNVAVSSITVSTLTVSRFLKIPSTSANISGRIVQAKFSSTTARSDTTSITFVPIPEMSQSLAVSNATNYIRISYSGVFEGGAGKSLLSISRDTANLVDGGIGSSIFHTHPVGVTFIHYPGDTSMHTYSATFRTDNLATFTANPLGYFLLEEISR
jgi:hypothetical protein